MIAAARFLLGRESAAAVAGRAREVGVAALSCARREGLAGALARVLYEVSPDHPARDGLEGARLRTFAQAARALELMERLGKALGRAGSRAAVLKGGALLAGVYRRRLDLRPLSDLDVLAPPKELEGVEAALAGLGLHRRGHVWCGGGVEVDLHRDLLGAALTGRRRGPYRLDPDLVWEHTAPCPVGAPGLVVLRDELMVLHLAVHALRHDFRRWIWLFDLVLAGADCDPHRLVELARVTRTDRALAMALALVERLFGPGSLAHTAPGLPTPSAMEGAYLSLAARRPAAVHLGEAVAGLRHARWPDRLACWWELLTPRRPLLELRLGPGRRHSRLRWGAATLAAGLGSIATAWGRRGLKDDGIG